MKIYEIVQNVLGLGLDPKQLTFLQMALRSIVVFATTLVMLRVGNKRFLAKMSAFDAVLGFILSSMLARAVNGSSAFFPTLGAGFVLVGLHSLTARLSFHFPWFGLMAKGSSDVLVENGRINRKELRRHKISEHDLMEEARLNGPVLDLEDIRRATIERSGEVSVIPVK